jgi:hypothetical protein
MKAQCPQCKEQVDSSANKCPYCHQELSGSFQWMMNANPLLATLLVLIGVIYVGWIYFTPLRFAISNFGKEKVLATIEVYEAFQNPLIKTNLIANPNEPQEIIFSEFINYRYSLFSSEEKSLKAFQKCAEKLLPLINAQYPNIQQAFTITDFKPQEFPYNGSTTFQAAAENRGMISTGSGRILQNSNTNIFYAVCRHETSVPDQILKKLKIK